MRSQQYQHNYHHHYYNKRKNNDYYHSTEYHDYNDNDNHRNNKYPNFNTNDRISSRQAWHSNDFTRSSSPLPDRYQPSIQSEENRRSSREEEVEEEEKRRGNLSDNRSPERSEWVGRKEESKQRNRYRRSRSSSTSSSSSPSSSRKKAKHWKSTRRKERSSSTVQSRRKKEEELESDQRVQMDADSFNKTRSSSSSSASSSDNHDLSKNTSAETSSDSVSGERERSPSPPAVDLSKSPMQSSSLPLPLPPSPVPVGPPLFFLVPLPSQLYLSIRLEQTSLGLGFLIDVDIKKICVGILEGIAPGAFTIDELKIEKVKREREETKEHTINPKENSIPNAKSSSFTFHPFIQPLSIRSHPSLKPQLRTNLPIYQLTLLVSFSSSPIVDLIYSRLHGARLTGKGHTADVICKRAGHEEKEKMKLDWINKFFTAEDDAGREEEFLMLNRGERPDTLVLQNLPSSLFTLSTYSSFIKANKKEEPDSIDSFLTPYLKLFTSGLERWESRNPNAIYPVPINEEEREEGEIVENDQKQQELGNDNDTSSSIPPHLDLYLQYGSYSDFQNAFNKFHSHSLSYAFSSRSYSYELTIETTGYMTEKKFKQRELIRKEKEKRLEIEKQREEQKELEGETFTKEREEVEEEMMLGEKEQGGRRETTSEENAEEEGNEVDEVNKEEMEKRNDENDEERRYRNHNSSVEADDQQLSASPPSLHPPPPPSVIEGPTELELRLREAALKSFQQLKRKQIQGVHTTNRR